MPQQTAVEWFIYKLNGCDSDVNGFIFNGVITNELIEEIKQMEKEQIMKAHKEGNKYNGWALQHEHEQYYNETYNK